MNDETIDRIRFENLINKSINFKVDYKDIYNKFSNGLELDLDLDLAPLAPYQYMRIQLTELFKDNESGKEESYSIIISIDSTDAYNPVFNVGSINFEGVYTHFLSRFVYKNLEKLIPICII